MSKLSLFLALVSALFAPAHAQELVGAPADPTIAKRLATLVEQMGEQELELTYRGKTVSVVGRIEAATDPCSPDLAAHGIGKTREWRRSLELADLAWLGELGPGQLSLVFFDPEARLANDIVTIKAVTGPGLRDAVTSLVAACRAQSLAPVAALTSSDGRVQSCNFPSVPGLTLYEPSGVAGERARAMLTLVSRQTPSGELTIMAERTEGAGDWANTSVNFIFAHPDLRAMGITDAEFWLEDRRIIVDHSLAAFGTTRLRISMDGFGGAGQANGSASFFDRLRLSRSASVVLQGADGQPKVRLDYEVAGVLAAARETLEKANWSCAGARVAPKPATRWRGSLD